MSEKVKILFLAANPSDLTQIQLDEEIRAVHGKIRSADFNNNFELVSRWAVRPQDLIQAFNEERPQIVHFSGHGSPDAELALKGDDGATITVSSAAFVSLFKSAGGNVQLVVLNACHSHAQAQALGQQVECTIGMNTEIGDDAAVVFASRFYGSLAFGLSVGQAFEQGRTELMLLGIPETDTPVLFNRYDIDPLTVTFVNRSPVNPVLPNLAWDILQSAVNGNGPVQLVEHDSGVVALAAGTPFDSEQSMERAALIRHSVRALVQCRWLEQSGRGLLSVTTAGFDAIRRRSGASNPTFLQVKKQLPILIAEMKQDLETENGQYVREFVVLAKRGLSFNSSKPRFVYFESEHTNLSGQLDILENYGYIINVTPKNTPIYRMTEEFIALMRQYA